MSAVWSEHCQRRKRERDERIANGMMPWDLYQQEESMSKRVRPNQLWGLHRESHAYTGA